MKAEVEERLIKHLTPKIERIVYKTLRDALPSELYYPPESTIKRNFIKRVLAAEKRVKAGKGKQFKSIEELKSYLDSLKR